MLPWMGMVELVQLPRDRIWRERRRRSVEVELPPHIAEEHTWVEGEVVGEALEEHKSLVADMEAGEVEGHIEWAVGTEVVEEEVVTVGKMALPWVEEHMALGCT